jgi:hypothetical protein
MQKKNLRYGLKQTALDILKVYLVAEIEPTSFLGEHVYRVVVA